MDLLNILYSIIISPLQLLFEVVFSLAYRATEDAGITIVVMSLAINFLVLPLYKRADAMQEEERDMQKRLHEGVSHIKKSFRGDERMLILQTYYRQNGYKPTYVLRGAVSLFLEIPFFIAAYQFLSHLSILEGVAFGPIADLGSADALITVGGLCINVLPIIMTAVNIISTAIFTSGHPLKTKLQLYGMALFFLVFLYTSPSGLVLYWTLNNIFSLLKTIYYKLRITERVKELLRIVDKNDDREADGKSVSTVFMMSVVALAVMIGLFIPSIVIASAPSDFLDLNQFVHPMWYILSAFCLAMGTFVVWINVFYRLASKRGRVTFSRVFSGVFAVAMLDYMVFSKSFGVLSDTLQYDNEMVYSIKEILINAGSIIAVFILVFFVVRKWEKSATFVITVCVMVMAVMSIANLVKINSEVMAVLEGNKSANEKVRIPLSKNGKNVIVLMLDRAQGEYVPFLFEEKPELKEMFSGFTYYSNVISYGSYTNVGSPSLYGGYDYTPYELNKRAEESLKDKQNEALKVMPLSFSNAGYNVTICDPTYAGYQWIPDLSIFDDHPEYHTYITNGLFREVDYAQSDSGKKNKNFFSFAFVKSLPLAFQPLIYQDGDYCSMNVYDFYSQTRDVHSVGDGVDRRFMNAYLVLDNLPEMTDIMDDGSDNFLMMSNDTTHEEMLLQKPDYRPLMHVDNLQYDTDEEVLYAGDKELVVEHSKQILHYHINMAALLRLGEWFDYMKENDVYDNTRIILAADHGRSLNMIPELEYEFENYMVPQMEGESDREEEPLDVSCFFPLLMVKDFGATEYAESDEFMTNAEVPAFALSGIVEDTVNPFTGHELSGEEIRKNKQYIFNTNHWDVEKNCGNQFEAGDWLSVHDSIWEKDNWKVESIESILPE